MGVISLSLIAQVTIILVDADERHRHKIVQEPKEKLTLQVNCEISILVSVCIFREYT
jgi:hypothetical protein